jgi:hypothetical protein
MNIKKLDLLKIRNLKFRASQRQVIIDRLIRKKDLEKDLWKISVKTLITLAKIKFRCEELERISENLQQTAINGY